MKILHLSLHKLAYEIMASGDKTLEFRKPSKWLLSRLFNTDGTPKNYDCIKFTNGYGKDRPYFKAIFQSWRINPAYHRIEYSNGLMVEVAQGDVIIQLGKIEERMF
jgi:hypothetical protein